ncbi:bifunctional 3-(3-hydroxy-phenyl)propionate/3-hydroxycinnamic acid hydroxylase [Variovorax sp. dw_954]|uniref:bifunctional 3-(3-hydroxy-phenyl)propionate/3-hydroxycinnamic acid hydroxylase MhpA n=1 Tax=Variovorax sp. dw_954 TaxID=2720078 RepID=UPI001BD5974D|nr:bifunctional 3-(3-hydroxy-phenyl)propionate/3-hydroxycinnamic acid hydroxylase [Variovorax sp. dw_954]
MTAPAATPLRESYDVAIVGLGPAGATLANLLALRGLSVLALDREADIYRLPRAIHFDGECMRVFQTVGIADEMAPHLVVAPGMRFLDGCGRLLIDWQRPTEIGPQGWHASYRFHQPFLEETLRSKLAAQACVDIRLRHEVFAVEPAEDHVDLRLEDTSSGKLLRTRARYVVGCDGARSTVRRFMGTELQDLKSHERWLVVDLLLHQDKPELGEHSIQYCDPTRPATYVRGVGNRRRWELMLLPGEDAAAMCRPEVVWQLLQRWITPAEATLERPAAYTFHSVVAQGWRKGRLLIAGDAAHQTPPFMGQGMCAGIRDASNLAWKLADVISGAAPDELLDTYESERSPHVREFIETAVRLGRVIQTTDVQAAKQRDADMLARPQNFATPQPRLGPGAHDGTPEAGRIGEQPAMADGTRLDDRVGYGHALIVDPAWVSDAQRIAGAIPVLPADSLSMRLWLERLGARAVLLRPDRYVASTAVDRADLPRMVLGVSGTLRKAVQA